MDADTAERLFGAYRTGLLFRDPEHVRPPKPTFYRLMMDDVLGRLSLRERLTFRKSYRASREGLAFARQKDLAAAEDCFAASRAVLDRDRAGEAARLLSLSFLEAALAFFEAQRGRLDEARACVAAALDCDLELETEHGFECLELHRVQAADNLMRIELRAGEIERGLALAGSVVAYADGQASSLPLHHGWRPDLMRKIPISLRRGAMAQIVNQLALAFPECPGPGVWGRLVGVLGPPTSATIHPRVRQWILIRQARARGDEARYLDLLLELLPGGRSFFPAAWFAAVLDLASYCGELGTDDGALVRRAILRDVKHWPDLPGPLRALAMRRRPGRERGYPRFASSSAQRA